jgi:hypothetical protein
VRQSHRSPADRARASLGGECQQQRHHLAHADRRPRPDTAVRKQPAGGPARRLQARPARTADRTRLRTTTACSAQRTRARRMLLMA